MLNQVFIVDDDPITVTICSMALKNSAFCSATISAENGKEGIDYFSKLLKEKQLKPELVAPDLILLDLNMPVLDGWGFLEEYIRKYADRLPETRLAILSSSINPQDYARANKYDIVFDFINKPLTLDIIEELKNHEFFKAKFIK